MRFALKERLQDMEPLLVQHVLLDNTALLQDLLPFLVLMECGQPDLLCFALLVMTGIFVNRLRLVQLLLEKPARPDSYAILMI